MDKISVIIPAYNMEAYIKKCLDSVINQTYTDLEIICIDDGSSDNSREICNEYAARDDRVRVLHQDNNGLSSALNLGIKNSTGRYLGFVDSDDWIEPNMYEELYKALTYYKTSIAITNYFKDVGDKCIAMENKEEIPLGRLSQRDMLLYAFRGIHFVGFGVPVWNKLFSTALIKNDELLFNEDIKCGMDGIFTTRAILTDNCTGTFNNKPLYHYYQRGSSISHSNLTDIKVSELNAIKSMVSYAVQCGYEDICKWQKRHHCYLSSLIAEKALQNNDAELFKEMHNEMNIYLREYIEMNIAYPERIERIKSLIGGQPH